MIMTDRLNRFWPLIASAAFAVLLAVNAAQSAAATQKGARAVAQSDTQTSEQTFAGAPDGVDPMVTGPVSTAFKQRQASANCDSAVWPNIPMVCYPD